MPKMMATENIHKIPQFRWQARAEVVKRGEGAENDVVNSVTLLN